jgi:hypothetical protein
MVERRVWRDILVSTSAPDQDRANDRDPPGASTEAVDTVPWCDRMCFRRSSFYPILYHLTRVAGLPRNWPYILANRQYLL